MVVELVVQVNAGTKQLFVLHMDYQYSRPVHLLTIILL
jgi:hypothetical protein